MSEWAVASRVLQFCAGPNEHRFYACEAHRPLLEAGEYSGLFFGVTKDEVQPENADDELQCDYCREG